MGRKAFSLSLRVAVPILSLLAVHCPGGWSGEGAVQLQPLPQL